MRPEDVTIACRKCFKQIADHTSACDKTIDWIYRDNIAKWQTAAESAQVTASLRLTTIQRHANTIEGLTTTVTHLAELASERGTQISNLQAEFNKQLAKRRGIPEEEL